MGEDIEKEYLLSTSPSPYLVCKKYLEFAPVIGTIRRSTASPKEKIAKSTQNLK